MSVLLECLVRYLRSRLRCGGVKSPARAFIVLDVISGWVRWRVPSHEGSQEKKRATLPPFAAYTSVYDTQVCQTSGSGVRSRILLI